MDKELIIRLMVKVIQDASANGKDYGWMYKPFNSLDDLCNELNISNEEIADIVGGFKQ